MLALVLLSAGGALLILWLAARLSPRERAARGLLADTLAEMEARRLQERLQLERELADRYYDAAFAARERGALEEAERLLDLAVDATEKSAETLSRLLASMAALSQTLPPARRRRLYRLHLRLTVTKLFLRDVRRTIGARHWDPARYANAIRAAEDVPPVLKECLEVLAALLSRPPRLSRWTDLRDAWRRWPEATAITLQVALFFVLLLAWHLARLSRPM